MAVSVTEITAAAVADSSNTTTYASAAFTPVANRLYLLAVTHSDAAAEATVPTVATTTGLNFVQVGSSIVFDTIASNVHRLTLFRAMKSSGLSNGTYTITTADASTGACGLLVEVSQVVTTGSDGADAVRNISTNNGDSSANPNVTMAGAFASNNNGVFACFGSDIRTAPTAPAGWTAGSDPDFATPNTGLFAQWTGANASSATCTLSSSDWAAIAVELVSEAVPEQSSTFRPDTGTVIRPKFKMAPLAMALAFVPLVYSPDPWVGGGELRTGTVQYMQYQELAGPTSFPYVPPTYDPAGKSWTNTYPDRHKYPRIPEFPAHVEPVHVPDVTQPVTSNSWQGSYPDWIARWSRKHTRPWFSYWYLPPDPAPHAAGGSSPAVGSIPILQYQDLFGPLKFQFVLPLLPQNEDAYPVYPDRIYRKQPQTLQSFFLRFTPPDPAPHAAGGSSPAVGSIPFLQYQDLAGPVFIPTPTPYDTSFNRSAYYPDRVYGKRSMGAGIHREFSAEDLTITAAPAPEPGYFAYSTSQRAVPKFIGGIYLWCEPQFGVEIPVPVMSWTGLYLDQPTRQRARIFQQAGTQDRFEAPDEVTTPDLSWGGSYPDRNPARKGLHAASQQVWTFDAKFDPPGVRPVNEPLHCLFPDRVYGKPYKIIYWPVHPMFAVVMPVPVMSWTGHYLENQRKRIFLHPHEMPSFFPVYIDISAVGTTYPGADGCGVF